MSRSFTIRKILALSLFALLAPESRAGLVNGMVVECGVYSVDGRVLKLKSGALAVAADHESDSQTTFYLEPPATELHDHHGLDVRVDILIERQCRYECRAKLMLLEKVLNPLEPKLSFAASDRGPKLPRPCLEADSASAGQAKRRAPALSKSGRAKIVEK